jgi:signal peptidase I
MGAELERKRMKSFLREVIITLILAAIIFFAARMTIQTYEVLMSSMEPNLYEGERVVVNKAAYYFGEPGRGDIIVFHEPNGTDDEFIKRVIGLPGDKVEVIDGYVYVNDTKLDEPYIMEPFNHNMKVRDIPGERYFVLGDNRNNSNDSEEGWLVPRENIIGKAWISTWPPDMWGGIPNYDLDAQLAGPEEES